MNITEYAALSAQVQRQEPELAALDAEIAARQTTVDDLQAALDSAQSEFDAITDGEAKDDESLKAARAALVGPKAALDSIKAQAESIRDAIKHCQQLMNESGLTDADVANFKPPVNVPQLVTMRQARLALLGAGLLDSVNTAVAAMTGVQGKAAQIEWEFSSEVQRSRPLVVGLGQALGLSDAQLDTLFVAASKL